MKYKVRPRITFPHEFEMYDVKRGSIWYASFALKEDAEKYCNEKNILLKNKY